MITLIDLLVGLVIFAIISNVYCLWSNIVETRKWEMCMEKKEQELKRCKMERKAWMKKG